MLGFTPLRPACFSRKENSVKSFDLRARPLPISVESSLSVSYSELRETSSFSVFSFVRIECFVFSFAPKKGNRINWKMMKRAIRAAPADT